MDIAKPEETSFVLPPARELLRSSGDEEDKMVIDEPNEVNSINEENKPSLPSMHSISAQTDDFIRHRMSDMTVSKQRNLDTPSASSVSTNKILTPLEPSSQQPYFESLSYSRRGSVTDPSSFYNYRRPSITDMSNLPLPNSAVVSRRESFATTDYDFSSRSPSPSSFTTATVNNSSNKRYHESELTTAHPYALIGRRDSLPGSNNHHPTSSSNHIYDSYQRRHSIASADHHTSINTRSSNTMGSTKYRAFQFPATIQESPNYRTYSAPPSPPQSALGNAGNQEQLHEISKLNGSRKNSLSRLHHPTNGGGGPLLPSSRRRPSILDDVGEGPGIEHLLVRRASMPVVTSSHRNSYQYDSRTNIPPPPLPQQQQQSRFHHEPRDGRHGSSDGIMEEEKRKETPYSRSPELRVSHKLAERKRRKEMKDLFDELRDSLPVEKNMKTSKWEILSKAVEYISLLKRRDYDLENEISGLRQEIDMIKRDRGGVSHHHNNSYGPSYA